METNLCKSVANAAENSTDMEYLKRHEHRPIHDAQNLFLARHVLPTPDCNLSCKVQIDVGCLYELDHTKLPPKSPIQLKSIRAVMVTEKTELDVSVMFPSILSLRTYFNKDVTNGNDRNLIHPELDEQYVMGSNLAGKVLARRISSQEFAKQKHLQSFWLVPPKVTEISTSIIKEGSKDDRLMKGMCWSALKYDGLVHWGVRRRVTFIGRHRLNNTDQLPSDVVKEEAETEDQCRKTRKRKTESSTVRNQKRENEISNTINNSNRNKLKLSKDRWSTERYKLAEGKILEIMKAKKAMFGNPMLRPALRLEARKHIGDTGLLDHLLKHMAGKVAPGGTERFRRRHNADGAMEYWLESADLINVRREAGVQDPYWTPPLGWKPGDSPSQDPICARELKLLRDEMAYMKRDVQELMSKKQEDDEASLTPKSSCDNFKLESESSVLLQEMYKDLVKRKVEVEEHLVEISKSLTGMQEEMQRLTCAMDKEKGKLAIVGGAENDKEEKGKEEEEEAAAAKRQRLRSGFRICKPQGTFLWPNMGGSGGGSTNMGMLSPQVVVPTPPSASSATSSAPRLLLLAPPPPAVPSHPTSPVKPLAKRRAVTVTVIPPDSACEWDNISTTLHPNDSGANNSNGFCGTPSSSSYKGHTLTTTIPRISSAGEKEVIRDSSTTAATVTKDLIQYQRQYQHQGGCSSSSSVGAGTWLALATPNPSLDEVNPRG